MTGLMADNATVEDTSHSRIMAEVWQEPAYLLCPFYLLPSFRNAARPLPVSKRYKKLQHSDSDLPRVHYWFPRGECLVEIPLVSFAGGEILI